MEFSEIQLLKLRWDNLYDTWNGLHCIKKYGNFNFGGKNHNFILNVIPLFVIMYVEDNLFVR